MKIDVSTQRAKQGRFTRVLVEVSDKELARVKRIDPAGHMKTLKSAKHHVPHRVYVLGDLLYFVEAAKRGKR